MYFDYPAPGRQQPRRREVDLALVCAAVVGLAAVLAATVGFPRFPTLPTRVPTALEVELLLRSPSLEQEAALVAAATLIAWLVWTWLVATVVLRVIVVYCERTASGEAWVGSLRSASDRVTLPWVRRTVDASLAALLVARVAITWSVPDAALADEQSNQLSAVTATPATGAQGGQFQPGDLLYTVRRGDSLGKIAERYYGDWAAYDRIYEANYDREQLDGRVLHQAGAIFPGWTLIIPSPTYGVDRDADGHQYCVVQPGDSLSSVAADTLGDAQRWPELFDLNRGVATMPDGRILTDPGLVWPGLRLRLPDPIPASSDPQPPLVTMTTADPVDTVASYYHLLDKGDFHAAAQLLRDGEAAWLNNSTALEPRGGVVVRSLQVLGMDPYQRQASVAVDLAENANLDGSPRLFTVTWQLVRGPDGWKLATSEIHTE